MCACRTNWRAFWKKEEAHIKLSALVTDLLGVRDRRMLQALAGGETDPAALAALAQAGHFGPVVRRAKRLHRAQPGVSVVDQDDGSTRPKDRESAPSA